jgi:hypothetical protein
MRTGTGSYLVISEEGVYEAKIKNRRISKLASYLEPSTYP